MYDYQSFLHTLPQNLCIKLSSILEVKCGIWSLEEIRCGTRFGPLKGIHQELMKNCDSEVEEMKVEFPDAENGNKFNWLSCINYICNKEQQNLLMFQYEEEIFYITSKSIQANTELLVWYKQNEDNKSGINENGCARNSIANINIQGTVFKIDKHYKFENYLNQKIPSHCNSCNITSVCDTHEEEFGINAKIENDLTLFNKERTFTSNIYAKTLIIDAVQDFNFPASNSLKKHERTHAAENLYDIRAKPYKCTTCGKKLRNRYQLQNHEKIHTGEKPNECTFCGMKFLYYGSLKQHKMIHTGEKPYECHVCGRKFRHIAALKIHHRIHTGEKPYECIVCGMKFRVKYSLQSHEWIHIREEPCECCTCGKKFIYNEQFLTGMPQWQFIN